MYDPRYVPPHLRGKQGGGGSEDRYDNRGGGGGFRNGGGKVWDDTRGSYVRDGGRDGHREDRGGPGRGSVNFIQGYIEVFVHFIMKYYNRSGTRFSVNKPIGEQ